MRYAIDLSHHQDPAALPWKSLAGNVHAVIARANYGAELKDRRCAEHVRRAREIGALVGLYLFYRPSQPVQKQFDVFRSVAELVDLGSGDIVPALDIEEDPYPKMQHVSASWAGPVLELAGKLDDWCGQLCMPYITQKDWRLLGAPGWILAPSRPLWVAHYTPRETPATPGGRACTMWQHRVGDFDPNGPGGYFKASPGRIQLDQNRVLGELPLIGSTPARAFERVDTEDHDDDEWALLRARETVRQQEFLDDVNDFKPSDLRDHEESKA